jgi:hypothetical protein
LAHVDSIGSRISAITRSGWHLPDACGYVEKHAWTCGSAMVCGLADGNLWVLGVGEEDPEGGATARAVLDPGAAAMQAGELGNQS